jgi:hypothetical protein
MRYAGSLYSRLKPYFSDMSLQDPRFSPPFFHGYIHDYIIIKRPSRIIIR